MKTLINRFKAWRKRRYWARLQLEHLQVMLQTDQRWLAHDPVASALTARYLAAATDGWESVAFEQVGALRARLGLTPERAEVDQGWPRGERGATFGERLKTEEERTPEGPDFTHPDEDLDNLLNYAASLAKGHGGMDLGVAFLEALENVEKRLKPRDLADEEGGMKTGPSGSLMTTEERRAAVAAQPGAAGKPLTDEHIMRFLGPWHVQGDEQDRQDLIAAARAMMPVAELKKLAHWVGLAGWKLGPENHEYRERLFEAMNNVLASAPTEAKPAQQDAVDAEKVCAQCGGGGEVYSLDGDGPWRCYACQKGANPPDVRLFAAFGRLTCLTHGHHVLPADHPGADRWLCVLFNTYEEAEEMRQALKAWHENTRPAIEAIRAAISAKKGGAA